MSENIDIVTLCAVGDVVVARKKWEVSFAGVQSVLRQADISFFNCETSYSDKGSPSFAPHGAGPWMPDRIGALTSAGFNVCSYANNHTLDWGIDAVIDCRERLEAAGISVCGAGKNIVEARKPAIVERKGVKVAFLGYCSTGPNWYLAEENKPGCAMVRVHTLYEPYDYQPGTPYTKVLTWAYKLDLDAMVEDIKKAKERADFVVVTDHWGIHNIPVIIPDYGFEVGHAAIDAGADLVLGTHPHILKGIEIYSGKVIVHSLANFCMELKIAEQENEQRMIRLKSFSELRRKLYGPTQQDQFKTVIVKCCIVGREITQVSVIPVIMDSRMANPEVLTRDDPRAQEIFDYIADITLKAGFQAKYRWDGDEIIVGL